MTYLAGVRLPPDIERGVVGGPRFNTSVLELDSGFEKRNQNWQDTRGEYDAGYGIMLKFQDDPDDIKLDIDRLINFFYVVRGKAYSFRLKDWSDYEVGMERGVDIDAQFLAFGDDSTTDFQLFKRYDFEASGNPHDRIITKPVDGTLRVYLEGILQTVTTHYTIDYDTGIVSMVTAPASTGGSGPSGEEVLTVRFEFDVHSRLDTDDLKINMEMFNAGSWPQVPLVELLGTGL